MDDINGIWSLSLVWKKSHFINLPCPKLCQSVQNVSIFCLILVVSCSMKSCVLPQNILVLLDLAGGYTCKETVFGYNPPFPTTRIHHPDTRAILFLCKAVKKKNLMNAKQVSL